MMFTYELKVIIKLLRQKCHNGAMKIISDHPGYAWKLGRKQTSRKVIDETGDIEQTEVSGCPKSFYFHDS